MRPSRTRSASSIAVFALALAAVVALPYSSLGSAASNPAREPIPPAPRIVPVLGASGGSATGLRVVAGRPQGEVPPDAQIAITFSKPVAPLATVGDQLQFPEPARIEPRPKGDWRWLGSAAVEFVPAEPLPPATAFTVTVSADLTAIDGSRQESPFRYAFATSRPALDSTEPGEGYPWVTPDQTFRLSFSQPIRDLPRHAAISAAGRRIGLEVTKRIDVGVEERKEADARRGRQTDYEWQQSHPDLRTVYEVRPTETLPAGSAVSLVVDGDLAGELGPLTLPTKREVHFSVRGPFAVRSLQACFPSPWDKPTCAYGPLIIKATNEPDPTSLKDRLTIDPPVEIDWSRVESATYNNEFGYAAVPANFKPGTTYTVTLAAGVTDVFGQAAAPFHGTFRTDDLPPSIDLGDEDALIEDSGDGALPVHTTNVDTIAVSYFTLTPAEVARYLGDGHNPNRSLSEVFGREPKTWAVTIASHHNVPRWSPLDLRSRLGKGARQGIVAVETPAAGRDDARRRRVIAQITDLALHAKLGATSGLAWVTSLAGGSPVPGARVALLDRTGKTVWENGISDADGLVKLPGVAELGIEEEYGAPFLLAVATKGNDTGITASLWTGGLDPWAFSLPDAWDGRKPLGLALIFAERGIYRPGDEVHLKGIVRYRRMGAIATPRAGTSAEVQIDSATGAVIDKRTVTLTPFGTFALDVKLPADVALGFTRATAKIQVVPAEASGPASNGAAGSIAATGGFRIEEYRAPQFRVDVTTPSAHLIAGEPLGATVLARYLFGGAMAHAPVRWTVTRSTTEFTPPGNAGFEFGVNAWWWDDEPPQPLSDEFAAGEGDADDQGSYTIAAGRAEAPGDRTVTYTLEAEATDVNRQRIANRARVTVHPASVYAGLRLQNTGFAEAGQPATFELVAVDPEGRRQAGTSIELKLTRRSWNWIKKRSAAGTWYTDTEAVDEPAGSCRVTSTQTSATCALTPEKPGFHIMAATVTDQAGRKQTTRSGFYVIGGGWVSWKRDDTDRIDLVPDKTSYDVGETARVLVKSPYPEAEAIVTVEREGVMSARRVHLAGAAATVDVPVGEDSIPNVFVSVVLVRGRVGGDRGVERGDDPGRPATRVGYCELNVEKKSKKLDVTLKPDGEEKRPRDTVSVELTVADARGRGVKSEVTAWAVDEGVLRLTNYKMPDLIELVHPRRGLSVRNAEPLIKLIERRLYAEKGVNNGGGGGADAGGLLRTQFKTTVLFAPEVVTDDAGHAHVEFVLPDNLTTYRIMAVAVTAADRFGAGEKMITVSKPLLALPALPRFARTGDRFDAGVVVHAKNAAAAGFVEVTAKAVGALLDGKPSRTVAVAPGKPVEVRFPFHAETPGTAVLRFTVRGAGESDGVEQKIPIRLPVGLETVAVYGETETRAEEALAGPRGVRSDVGGLRITLSSTLLGGLAEPMRQLVEYPYGCAEQLSSRLVPFVALRQLQKTYVVAPDAPVQQKEQAKLQHDMFLSWLGEDTLASYKLDDPDELVRATIKAIQALQNPDGGFRFWPDSRCSDPWASSYVTLALATARDAGYEIDGAALERAETYLSEQVLPGREIPGCYGPARPSATERAFALFALARAGAPRMSYAPELFQGRDALPLFARAMLADALTIGGGDRRQAQQIVGELANHGKETAQGFHFEEGAASAWDWAWSSDARTTAIALLTFADAAPDHPYVAKMARYLTTTARRRDGRFANTQEAAFTLLAMEELTRTKERVAPNYTAQVKIGDRTVAAAEFRKRSLDVKTTDVPIAEVATGGRRPFLFEKTGEGILYYTARLQSAPRELPRTALDRGLIVQRWLEPWSGGIATHAVAAGELIRIKLRVATSQERRYVVLEVPLPAGIEAIDTSLATSARPPGERGAATPASEDEGDDGGDTGDLGWYELGFWNPFGHVELRDDRVLMFADWLPAGVHSLSLVARATTPGTFVLQPARAEEMYTPEVFGRSDGGTFVVLAPETDKK
jgi:uncharacterized protein YfaS (alpha-2-macroglobulin family)